MVWASHLSKINMNILLDTLISIHMLNGNSNSASLQGDIPLQSHAHSYMFVVVNFDALAQASDIQIERRQVVFLC